METKRKGSRIKKAIWILAKKGENAEAIFALPNGIKIQKNIGKATQAQADHLAMQEALDIASKEKGKIIIYTESALLEGQLIKKWQIKANRKLAYATKKKFKGIRDKVNVYKINKKENLARK